MRLETGTKNKIESNNAITYLNYLFEKCLMSELKHPYKKVVVKDNSLLQKKYKSKDLRIYKMMTFFEYYGLASLSNKYNKIQRMANEYDLNMPKLVLFFHYIHSLHLYPKNKAKALILNNKK